jgi:hypothetical protein
MLADLLPTWVRDAIWIGGVLLMLGAAVGSLLSWRGIRRDVDDVIGRVEEDVTAIHKRLDKHGVPGANVEYPDVVDRRATQVVVAPVIVPGPTPPEGPVPGTRGPATQATDVALGDLKETLGIPRDTTPPPSRVVPPIPVPPPTVSYALAPPPDELERRFRQRPMEDVHHAPEHPGQRDVRRYPESGPLAAQFRQPLPAEDVPTAEQQAEPTRPDFRAHRPTGSTASGAHRHQGGRHRAPDA